MTKIITTALFYANGDLHLGHILEQIQADIWVRFNKMQGIPCYFIGGDDTHGTPIMLKAEELGISPEELIAKYFVRHCNDYKDFNICYDNYYTTNSQENQHCVYEIYQQLKVNNKITKKVISQLFDVEKQIFLPDRFIKGTCPKCFSHDQYGDNCENCGGIYAPTDLLDPYSIISNTVPIIKESEHYFFALSSCAEFLKIWLDQPQRLGIEAQNKMQEWLNEGLKDWDISRDAPYFGFKIPDDPQKYFYVWLDAPIGYLSILKNLCYNRDIDFKQLWNSSEIYHFVGKDILYFHSLFWPAVLEYANYKTPQAIYTHGYLNINGLKMSKSRGTFITARSYLDSGLNPEYLRYYFATKLSPKIEDLDLALDDFMARVNSELVGKFINIAARTSGFLSKYFKNILTSNIDDSSGILIKLIDRNIVIKNYYQKLEYAKAIKQIMLLVDEINHYIDQTKPWQLAKNNELITLHNVVSVLINAFKIITVYLKPVIPAISQDIEKFLNIEALEWDSINHLLNNHQINDYHHLINRIEIDLVNRAFSNN